MNVVISGVIVDGRADSEGIVPGADSVEATVKGRALINPLFNGPNTNRERSRG